MNLAPKYLLLIVGLVAFTVGKAQLNLKDKLNRKADRVLDNFLFGEDGKSKDQANDQTMPDENDISDDYSSDEETFDASVYTSEPADFGQVKEGSVVNFRELIKFLPNSFGSYTISKKPEGSTMNFGEYVYSIATKEYSNGNQELEVSIFDYLKTGEMLDAYTYQYAYESTEGMAKSVEVDGGAGWYTIDYETSSSGIALVVNRRFLISFSGHNLKENELIEYCKDLKLGDLPQSPEIEE